MYYFKKLLRDLALTLYDHPTEFQCLSLARIWITVFGIMIVITWYREEFQGIKFGSWAALTALFSIACGAYGLKKWQEGKAQQLQAYNSQQANMRE